MANSQKLSELSNVSDIRATDLFLISRDENSLSSCNVDYNTISANLYSSIYMPLDAKITALSNWIASLLSGEPDLNKISGDWGNRPVNHRVMVGVKAVHDLANIVNNWKPLWQ